MALKGNHSRIVLFFIVFTDMMGFSLLFPLFPKTIEHFLQKGDDPVFRLFFDWAGYLSSQGNSPYTMVLFGGILGSIYSLLQFLASPLWGRYSDKVGRRSVLLFTTFGNILGYLVWIFSSQFWMFVLSRVITGAMGGNLSVASAAMADHTDSKNRAAGMGLLGAGIGLGFVMGPLLGGISSQWTILDSFYESGLFVVFPSSAGFAILISIITFLLVLFFLPKTKPDFVSTGEIHPLFALRSSGSQALVRISLLNLLFVLSFSGFEFVVNFYLAEGFMFSPKEIGFTFLYIGIIIILVQGGLVRRLSGKWTEKKIVFVGVCSVLFGLLSLLATNGSFGGLFFSLFFLALGSALVNPGLSAFASLASGHSDLGKSMGLFRSFGSLGRAISPIAFSLLYFQKGPGLAFYTSFLLLLGFLYFLRNTREIKI
ncbi:MFS transporter [Leptospira sp. 96542]|nr:MFS transporter [Leptospira sp. 96542]